MPSPIKRPRHFKDVKEQRLWWKVIPARMPRRRTPASRIRTSTRPQRNSVRNSVMKLSTIIAGSAASLLLHGFAFAQQQSDQQGQGQQLSNREVRQFMSGIERDV